GPAAGICRSLGEGRRTRKMRIGSPGDWLGSIVPHPSFSATTSEGRPGLGLLLWLGRWHVPKLCDGLRQGGHVGEHARRRRGIVAGLVSIDPDAFDAHAPGRRHVVEPAAGGVDPVGALDAALLLEAPEVAELRL